MLFQELPGEITRQVFMQLEPKEKYKCIFLCKSLYGPAKQAFHYELILSVRTLFFTHLKFRDITEPFYECKLINKLVFRREYATRQTDQKIIRKFELDEMLKLFSFLPNLITFNVRRSSFSDYYMTLLRDIDPSYLPNIQRILHGNGSYKLNQTYFQIFYNFRKTLRYIELEYDCIKAINAKHGHLFTYLGAFNNLTHLLIENRADKNMTFMDILDNFPNVINFDYSSKYVMPDTVFIPKPYTRSQRKLETLKIIVPEITEVYMDYLIYYYFAEKRIRNFTIYSQKVNLFKWVKDRGVDYAINFCRYFRFVRNLNFYFTPSQKFSEECGVRERDTILYSVINAIMGDRKLICDCRYTGSFNADSYFQVTNNDKIFVCYNVEFETDNDDLTKMILPLPDKSISIIGPEIWHIFLIGTPYKTLTLGYSELQYVFDHCSRIQEFDVNYSNEATKWDVLLANCPTADITIKGPMPSQDYLSYLVSYLPQTESLTIVTYLNPKTHYDHNFTLDLTKFKYLKRLSFDVATIITGVTDFKFIIINSTNTNTFDYYEIDKLVKEQKYTLKDSSESEYRAKKSFFSSTILIKCCQLDHIAFSFSYEREVNRENKKISGAIDFNKLILP